MLLSVDFDRFFMRSLEVLAPYLDDIVCAGGCASALYRFHELSSTVNWGYLGTKDVDVAVPQELPLSERPPVARLMEEAGFEELKYGDADEAVIKYGPRDKDVSVDLQFLCPLSGLKGTRRKDPVAYSVQEGLFAQPLRYLEMLLTNNWVVGVEKVPGFEAMKGTAVKVPNPAAYVVQKILIRGERRSSTSMEKDCFYIYEISVIFRDAFDKIREEYENLSPCAPKWKKRFATDVRALFASEDSEGPISAVRVYKDAASIHGSIFTLTPEIVHRSVGKFLDAMIG